MHTDKRDAALAVAFQRFVADTQVTLPAGATGHRPALVQGRAGYATVSAYLRTAMETPMQDSGATAIAHDRPDLTDEAFISTWAGSGAFPVAVVALARERLDRAVAAHWRWVFAQVQEEALRGVPL